MTNQTIKIALSSILIYLSCKKLYDILSSLLIWLNVEMRNENEAIFIVLNILLASLSLVSLIILANKFLKPKSINNRNLYFLIGLTAILIISIVIINKLFGTYLANIELAGFYRTYSSQYGWTGIFNTAISIVGLLYFLWKLKRNTEPNISS